MSNNMSNNIFLPFEIINKILLMRQPHPIVNILRDYAKIFLYDFDVNNIFYCKNPLFWMQNNDCCGMYCFIYKYKSYRRKYKSCIDEIEREIVSYNIFINIINDSENYTFKTFEKAPEWNIVI